MKKNNIILAIVLVAFVLCVVLVIGFRLKPTEEEVVNIDLNVLKTNIDTETTFGEMTMQEVDKDILKDTFNINAEMIEEAIGKIPLINVHSSTYVVVKTSTENVSTIKEKFEEYGRNYEEQWKKYLPEEYELVKKRKIGSKGDYVYFIVSDSVEEIVEMIK